MNERLPARSRLLYASGSIGGNAISRSLDLWLLFYYAPPDDADISRRAATLAAGGVIALTRLVEALDDPLIGYLSDRTRSRWGRRIPYVVVATPLLSLAFVLLWTPPAAGESVQNILYLFVALWFFHLFSTLSGGPFESLLPEIAPRHDDRLSIVSWQVMFGVAGAVLGLAGTEALVAVWGFRGMAVVIGLVALASRFVALAGAWPSAMRTAKERPAPARMPSFRQAVATCLRNGQFAVFLPTFILYNMGVQMMTGVLPFLVDEVLKPAATGPVELALPPLLGSFDVPLLSVTVMTGVVIVFLVLSLPVVVVAARRSGKSRVYSRGMLFAAAVFPLLFFVGFVPRVPTALQALGFAALLGPPLAPPQTFPNALIADITDYDALRTGMRREATYYATQATFEKVASAAAPALLALLLALGSTTEHPIGIRLVGPVAGLATLVGYVVFRGYWLPDSVTEETVRAAAPRP